MTNPAPSNTQPAQLLHKTLPIALFIGISNLLGFTRDVILAHFFGATPAFDAFVAVFKIPDCLRRLFGDGAFSQVLVPALVDYQNQHSRTEMREFFSELITRIAFWLTIFIVVAELFAPSIIGLIAPGFRQDSARQLLASELLRITLPYLWLLTGVAFAGALQNTYRRFLLPAFTPIVFNLTLIMVALISAPHTTQSIATLAWGVVLGSLLQLLLQWPCLRRLQLLPHWVRPQRPNPAVQRLFKRMIPALIAASGMQINLFIDNLFASTLPVGSLSWLYYSDRLTDLPLGILGAALAIVVMPQLAWQHTQGQQQAFQATLNWAVRAVGIAGIPATCGLALLAGPILATLIFHGAFGKTDVLMASGSLAAFALGLPALMLQKILIAAFYAQHNIKTPFKIGLFTIGCHIAFCTLLLHPRGHVGLALATSLSAWLNVALLGGFLIQQGTLQRQAGDGRLIRQLGFTNLLTGGLLWYFTQPTTVWLVMSLKSRILTLSCLIIATLFINGLLLYLTDIYRHLLPSFTRDDIHD